MSQQEVPNGRVCVMNIHAPYCAVLHRTCTLVHRNTGTFTDDAVPYSTHVQDSRNGSNVQKHPLHTTAVFDPSVADLPHAVADQPAVRVVSSLAVAGLSPPQHLHHEHSKNTRRGKESLTVFLRATTPRSGLDRYSIRFP